MSKVGSEKLGKNSLKNNIIKSEGGIASIWSWITRKNKWDLQTLKIDGSDCKNCQKLDEENQLHFKVKLSAKDLQLLDINGKHIQTPKSLNKRSQLRIELKLNAKDLESLKTRGIDIQALRNLNKINKKRQMLSNQAFTLSKDKLHSKENGSSNECIVSLKKRKPVSDLKSDAAAIDPTRNITINSKRERSQRSVVNNLSYKVGIKSNTEIISQTRLPYRSILMESVPSRILHTEVEGKTIPMLLTKIKSMEEQLRNIELKTKNMNDSVSKQNVFKVSPARRDLNSKHSSLHVATPNCKHSSLHVATPNCKHSSLHVATPNCVSYKIYSKNAHYSKCLRKNRRKYTRTQKNYNYISSSSDQYSKTDELKIKGYPFQKFKYFLSAQSKNKGYPFQNFKDSLNNGSIDYTKSMKEIFVGQTLLKSDCSLAKTEIQSNDKQSLKSQSLQLSKECSHISLTGKVPNECVNDNYCHKHRSDNKSLKSVQYCDVLQTAIAGEHVRCKSIYTSSSDNSKWKFVNQNENAIEESTLPLTEKHEPKINITILIEDNLKKSVNVLSSITKNVKECADSGDFCNLHYENLLGDNNKKEERSNCIKDHCIKYINCTHEESNGSTVNHSLKLKNNRIYNEIGNNLFKVRTAKYNQSVSTVKSINHTEDVNLQFGIQSRYLYQKDREQLDELYLDKQSIHRFVDPYSKTNLRKKYCDFQNDTYTINHEPNYPFKEIKVNCYMNDDPAENKVKYDSNLTIKSQDFGQSDKQTPQKPLLELTDYEIKKLNLIKDKPEFETNRLEEKQQFFRVVNENEGSPVDKSIFKYSKKRTCRYGLTLSQEPILEESEDEMSAKDMNHSECQSNKGDSIEIKSVDCECNFLTETIMFKKDINSPIFEWITGKDKSSDNIPVESTETSSVSVQTDWSLIAKSFNEISSQTDITMTQMVLFDEETIDKSDSCKCFIYDSQVGELVSCDSLTMQSKESEIIPSKYFAKKQRSLAIKMRKENITEVKLSDLLISVVRDSENTSETASSNCVVPKNVVTITANKGKEIGTSTDALISSDVQINPEIPTIQQMEMLTNSKINQTVESLHQCSARCFYSHQESNLVTESQLETTASKVVQNTDSTFSKTQVNISCDSITSDVTKLSPIEEGIESRESHMVDHFCEETIEKGESDDNATVMNPNKSGDFRSNSSIPIIDSPFENSDEIKKYFDELDFEIMKSFLEESKARAVTQQRVTMTKTHVLNDSEEKICDNLLLNENNTCQTCCIACKLDGCAVFGTGNSSESLTPNGCITPENTMGTD